MTTEKSAMEESKRAQGMVSMITLAYTQKNNSPRKQFMLRDAKKLVVKQTIQPSRHPPSIWRSQMTHVTFDVICVCVWTNWGDGCT